MGLYSNPNITMIAVAVIPAIFLMVQVYRLDRLEKEPTKLLVSLVFLGLAAVALAIITELLGAQVLSENWSEDSVTYQILLNFIVVGISEEFFKFLFLRIRTWRNPNFNCQFDGVVYAVFISLGFALFENIGYTFQYGIGTALLRALTSIPGHASFGVFMGVFYGAAKRAANAGHKGRAKRLQFFAVAIPVLLHGSYDYCATDLSNSVGLYVIFTLLMFIVAYLLIRKMAKSDTYIDTTPDTKP